MAVLGLREKVVLGRKVYMVFERSLLDSWTETSICPSRLVYQRQHFSNFQYAVRESKRRQCLFGEVVAGQMGLNATGLWVQACWQRLPYQFSQKILDAFVITPNHLHGILWLGGDRSLDGDRSGRGEAFGQKTLEQPKTYHPNASPPPNPDVSLIPDSNVLSMNPKGGDDIPRKGEAFGQNSGDTCRTINVIANPSPQLN
jgi:hypothetical protein